MAGTSNKVYQSANDLIDRSPYSIEGHDTFDPAPVGRFKEVAIFAYDRNPNEAMPARLRFQAGVDLGGAVPAAVVEASTKSSTVTYVLKDRNGKPKKDKNGKPLRGTKTVTSPSVTATQIPGLTSVEIADTDEEAIVNVNASFFDPDRFALALLQPGVWFSVFYVDEQGHAFEWVRAMVWEHSATDKARGETSITATDLLGRLHKYGQEDKILRKDGTHPSGWTAKQILEDACKLVGATPIALYNSGKRFPYLKLENASPYERIVKAYSLDTKLTANRYRIRAEAGQIVVSLRRINKDRAIKLGKAVVVSDRELDAIDTNEALVRQVVSDHNMHSADYRASLDGFATRLMVRAASGFQYQGTQQAQKRFLTMTFRNKLAEEALGPFYKKLDLQNSGRDFKQADLLKVGKNYLKQISRRSRQAEIEADGNPIVRAGDAVYLEDYGTGLVGYFFCQKVTHSVSGQYHSMKIELTETVRLPQQFPTKDDTFIPDSDPQGGGDVTATGITKLLGVPFVGPLLTHEYSINQDPLGHTTTGSHGHLVPPPESFSNSRDQGGWPSNWAFDLGAPVGTPVYAPIAGTVKYVEDRGAKHPGSPGINGWTVIIDSGKGLAVGLFHMTKPNVSVGQNVTIGQRISSITSWEAPKTGVPHVHISAGPSWKSQAINRSAPSLAQFKRALDVTAGKPLPVQTTTPAPGTVTSTTSTVIPPGSTLSSWTGNDLARGIAMGKRINAYFKSWNSAPRPMHGTGELFVKYGMQYKVDPTFLAARCIMESELGLKCIRPFNPLGIGGTHPLTFTSFEEAIKYMSNRLATLPDYNGLASVDLFVRKYVGISFDGPPTTEVTATIDRMRKMGSATTKVRGWKIGDWQG